MGLTGCSGPRGHKGWGGVGLCPSCCFSTLFSEFKTQGSPAPHLMTARGDRGLSHVPGPRSCCAEGQRGNQGRDGDRWHCCQASATAEGQVSEDRGAASTLDVAALCAE